MGNLCASPDSSVVVPPVLRDNATEDTELDSTERSFYETWKKHTQKNLSEQKSIMYPVAYEGFISVRINIESGISTTITDEYIDNILLLLQNGYNDWLRTMKGSDGFPPGNIVVRLYGITCTEDIVLDLVSYAKFPIQTVGKDWEENPWNAHCKWCTGDWSCQTKKTWNHVYSRCTANPSGLDHYHVTFSVSSKLEALGYAQPHYIRCRIPLNYTVILHEIGHTFWLDDFYDKNLYVAAIQPNDIGKRVAVRGQVMTLTESDGTVEVRRLELNQDSSMTGLITAVDTFNYIDIAISTGQVTIDNVKFNNYRLKTDLASIMMYSPNIERIDRFMLIHVWDATKLIKQRESQLNSVKRSELLRQSR